MIEENDQLDPTGDDAKKRRILWISVTLITGFLVIIWGFGLKNYLVSFNWSQSAEQQIVQKANADWQAANDIVTGPMTQKKAAQNEIEKKLIELAGKNMSSTEATGTAEENSATTTFATNSIE